MIERDHEHIAHRLLGQEGLRQPLEHEAGPLPLLDLDQEAHAVRPGHRQRLGEGRDARAGKGRIEPGAGIELAQGGQIVVGSPAMAVRGAVDDLVMEQHDLGVARQHDVDLAAGGTVPGRRDQCGERVLRCRDAVAAMGADMDPARLGRERTEGHQARAGAMVTARTS